MKFVVQPKGRDAGWDASHTELGDSKHCENNGTSDRLVSCKIAHTTRICTVGKGVTVRSSHRNYTALRR